MRWKNRMDATLRTMIPAICAMLSVAVEARAASVYVRLESARTVDPLIVDAWDGGHFASADLTTGQFRALATATVDTVAVNTGAGIHQQLSVTNDNAFPFTIWRGTLTAHVEGAYQVVPPAFAVGTGTDSGAQLFISTDGPSGTIRVAEFDHSLRANGFAPGDQNSLIPTSEGGGTVVVSEASFTTLVADLGMPSFTLLPGQTMYVSFQVDVSSQRNSTADFYFNGRGAQLRLDLPAGVTLDTDASAPLVWVTVPEPDSVPMLAAGGIALIGWAGLRVAAPRHRAP